MRIAEWTSRSPLWSEGFVFTFQFLICAVCERTLIFLLHPPSLNLSFCFHVALVRLLVRVVYERGVEKKAVEITNKSICMTHLLGFKTLYPSFTGPLLLSEGIRCLFIFFQRRMDWKLYVLDFFWVTADIIKRHNGTFSLDYCQN